MSGRARLFIAGLFVLIYAGSRLPMLSLGYGSDDDGWLIAGSADRLVTNHEYETSRFPGYPVPELGYAAGFALFGTSWWSGNAISAVLGLLALAVFYRIARRLDLRDALACTAALMFYSWFWIGTTATHDMIWSVGALLLAFLAAISGRHGLAGAALGIAVGCKISNGILIVPLLAYFVQRGASRWAHARFAVSFALSCVVVLAPLALSYGASFLDYSPPKSVDYVTGGYRVYAEVFGAPFLAVAATFLVVHLLGTRRDRLSALGSLALLRGDRLVLAGAFVALSLPFVFLPLEAQYMLAAVPFLILLVGGVKSTGFRRAMLAGLMINAFVGVVRLDVEAWRERRELVVVPISRGSLLADVAYRRRMLEGAQRLLRVTLPSPAAIVVGPSFFPLLSAMGVPERDFSHHVARGDTGLYRVMTAAEFDGLRGRVPLYYVDGENLPYLMRRIYGYSLLDAGARPLRGGDRPQ